MKIEFQDPAQPPATVVPAQMEMRRKPPQKRPVFLVTSVVAVLCAGAYFFYWWNTRSTIYTYGLVASRTFTVHAPFRARILHWHPREGTIVKKGDVLCEFASDDAIRELQEAEANVVRLKSHHEALTLGPPPERLREVETVQELDRLEEKLRDVGEQE
ncbi:MAG: biotin/lipoyl-binding protein, partial [Planctomycetota bacterium]